MFPAEGEGKTNCKDLDVISNTDRCAMFSMAQSHIQTVEQHAEFLPFLLSPQSMFDLPLFPDHSGRPSDYMRLL